MPSSILHRVFLNWPASVQMQPCSQRWVWVLPIWPLPCLACLLIDRFGRRFLMYICSFGYLFSLSSIAYAFFTQSFVGMTVPILVLYLLLLMPSAREL
jgi:hypothetical protein